MKLFKQWSVDPTQPVRLLLVAPSFSQTLINRCKWIDAPISLFTYSCLKFDNSDDIVPVFNEQAIPSPIEQVEIYTIDNQLKYITDSQVKENASTLLNQAKQLKPDRISMDAVKGAISMKVDGRVFAYLYPRQKHFVVGTYNADDVWTDYPINGGEDLIAVLGPISGSVERRSK